MKNEAGKIKIEKGVPIPPRYKHSGLSEMLRSLKRGESFVYHSQMSAITSAQNLNIKIVTRKLPGREGFRIWRIK